MACPTKTPTSAPSAPAGPAANSGVRGRPQLRWPGREAQPAKPGLRVRWWLPPTIRPSSAGKPDRFRARTAPRQATAGGAGEHLPLIGTPASRRRRLAHQARRPTRPGDRPGLATRPPRADQAHPAEHPLAIASFSSTPRCPRRRPPPRSTQSPLQGRINWGGCLRSGRPGRTAARKSCADARDFGFQFGAIERFAPAKAVGGPLARRWWFEGHHIPERSRPQGRAAVGFELAHPLGQQRQACVTQGEHWPLRPSDLGREHAGGDKSPPPRCGGGSAPEHTRRDGPSWWAIARRSGRHENHAPDQRRLCQRTGFAET